MYFSQFQEFVFTASVTSCMIRLTVHPEAALLHCTKLLQFLVKDVHCLLHTLSLCHWNLAHTGGEQDQNEERTSYCTAKRVPVELTLVNNGVSYILSVRPIHQQHWRK